MLSWNLFGKINFEWLFGKKSLIIYNVLALVFIFLGTIMQNDLVWEIQDMCNNLIVLPNAIALFALTGLVLGSLKHHEENRKNR